MNIITKHMRKMKRKERDNHRQRLEDTFFGYKAGQVERSDVFKEMSTYALKYRRDHYYVAFERDFHDYEANGEKQSHYEDWRHRHE